MKKLPLLFPLFLLMIACGGSDKPTTPKKAAPQVSEAEAKRLFNMRCSVCHGADGKLMIGGAPDITLSTKTLAEREALITYGKGLMPPQKDVLSAAEIKAVAKYSMELSK